MGIIGFLFVASREHINEIPKENDFKTNELIVLCVSKIKQHNLYTCKMTQKIITAKTSTGCLGFKHFYSFFRIAQYVQSQRFISI